MKYIIGILILFLLLPAICGFNNDEIITAINQFRIDNGFGLVVENNWVNLFAEWRAKNRVINITHPEFKNDLIHFNWIVKHQVFTELNGEGEVCITGEVGQLDTNTAIKLWENSPPHKNAILQDYDFCGVYISDGIILVDFIKE